MIARARPSPWQDGQTALVMATNNGDFEATELLLKYEANTEKQTKVKWGEGWEALSI